jgi:hypothetical protein
MSIHLLLLALFFCHFLGDFVLFTGNDRLLAAKSRGTPTGPILDHATIHGLLVMVTLMMFGVDTKISAILGIYQLVAHFGIDVLKGRTNVWFPSCSSPMNKSHWALFGFDQFLHVVVIIRIAYLAA